MKISSVRPDINRLFTLQRGDTTGTSISLGIFKGDSASLTLYTYPPNYPVYYAVTLAAWHYAAVSFDSGRWRLYLDGRMVDSDTASMHQGGGTGDAAIGGLGDCRLSERGFDGALDEVRFDRVARSDDRILLRYLNQKADNKLVVFK